MTPLPPSAPSVPSPRLKPSSSPRGASHVLLLPPSGRLVSLASTRSLLLSMHVLQSTPIPYALPALTSWECTNRAEALPAKRRPATRFVPRAKAYPTPRIVTRSPRRSSLRSAAVGGARHVRSSAAVSGEPLRGVGHKLPRGQLSQTRHRAWRGFWSVVYCHCSGRPMPRLPRHRRERDGRF